MSEKFVLGLDVGTTTIRGFVYNNKGVVVGSCSEHAQLLYPHPGWVEIDPDLLWEKIQLVLRGSLEAAGLASTDISAMGISCQRATFTCWSKVTGKHYHNLITWKDLRADKMVMEWNDSWSMKLLRIGGKFLHSVSRLPRYKAAGILKLYNKLVTLRLLWALDNVPGLREAADRGEVMFGCIDSWLLYKLTSRHMTEVSNIAATGIFDPFTMSYAGWVFTLFNIPGSIMPPIVPSSGEHFGSTLPDILGSPVPIRAVLADQSASVFGSGCFTPGSAKITLGTGSFLDVVTANPHASMNGLVPLVAWKLDQEKFIRTDKQDLVPLVAWKTGEEKRFLAEGSTHDTGVMIEWAQTLGFFQDISTVSDTVSSLTCSEGIFFVPGFHGLQAPVSDPSATAGFIGVSLKSTKEQMLRAILESIAFSQKQLVEAFLSETNYKFEKLVVDGGVAKNDFILQLIADLTGLPVIRPDTVEMSVWGVASLAGLEEGVWKDRTELTKLRGRDTVFTRNHDNYRCLEDYSKWLKACFRFTSWNN